MEKNGEKIEKGGVKGEPGFPSKYKYLVSVCLHLFERCKKKIEKLFLCLLNGIK